MTGTLAAAETGHVLQDFGMTRREFINHAGGLGRTHRAEQTRGRERRQILRDEQRLRRDLPAERKSGFARMGVTVIGGCRRNRGRSRRRGG
jgi:hypothetical protein